MACLASACVLAVDLEYWSSIQLLINNPKGTPFISNNSDEHLLLYRNDSKNDNHYLSVRLISPGANSHGIGAHIAAVIPTGERQVREMGGGNNFLSHNPYEVQFGLGEATQVDITVNWPDGSVSTQTAEADQQITISQPVP